uniref:Uncharacterized protein n=1 Tax=Caenorhabditis japonica TaxID=281687 RepID=A0A8R1ICS9_CAEJA
MIGEMHNKTIFMGVGAFTGYYNNDDFNYFYNIQGFRKEVYELTGIINENDFVSTTVSTTASTNVTTSTVPATTTSECNQVTGFDQIERVTREPLDDEEKIKPIPNDVKTDRNAWPVMMINVEDSSDTVYEEEVKELFVSSSFFNGDGDEKKHFNILIGVIFYWIFVN